MLRRTFPLRVAVDTGEMVLCTEACRFTPRLRRAGEFGRTWLRPGFECPTRPFAQYCLGLSGSVPNAAAFEILKCEVLCPVM